MAKPKWILLVEDNPYDADLAMRVLSTNKSAKEVEVIVARDGVEALDCLHRQGSFQSRPSDPPLLMLLDLKMPKMDGLEVLRQVKADPELKSIPVVILTSSRETVDVSRSYELGANGYVVKPVNFDEFTTTITALKAFWTAVNEPPPDHVENTRQQVERSFEVRSNWLGALVSHA
jgi:CheY-like chemotaxis protein